MPGSYLSANAVNALMQDHLYTLSRMNVMNTKIGAVSTAIRARLADILPPPPQKSLCRNLHRSGTTRLRQMIVNEERCNDIGTVLDFVSCLLFLTGILLHSSKQCKSREGMISCRYPHLVRDQTILHDPYLQKLLALRTSLIQEQADKRRKTELARRLRGDPPVHIDGMPKV